MLRLVVVVFFGKPRSDQARAGREAPWVMIAPLMILAIPAFASGFGFVAKLFLHLPDDTMKPAGSCPGLALAATLAGMTLAILLYRKRESDPIDFALLRQPFLLRRDLRLPHQRHAGSSRQHLGLHRSLDSRCRLRPGH